MYTRTKQVFLYLLVPLLSLMNLVSFSILDNEDFPFDFTFTVSNCNEVNFAITGGVPITQAWDFGNGFSDSAVSPTHFYGQPGTYNVCLTATDGTLTNTTCHAVTIDATDCCVGPVAATSDLGKCCFSLELDNPFQEFYTGIRVTLPSPYTFSGVNFDFNNWGLATQPTNIVELGYIGANHIPSQNNLPALDFCINQATAGPVNYTIELLIGPNVICSITDLLDCTICVPNSKTANTTLESKVNPPSVHDYLEKGTDIIVDKNTDDIFVLGTTGNLDELGSQANLLFQKLDPCADQDAVSMVVTGNPVSSSNYQIQDAKFIDIRSQGLVLSATPVAFVAICTARKGAQSDYVLVFLDANGGNLGAVEHLNLSPESEEIENVIRVGVDEWIIVGTCKSGLPVKTNIFASKVKITQTNTTIDLIKTYFDLGVNWDRTTGMAVAHDPSSGRLYFTGKAPNGQLGIIVTDINLAVVGDFTIDVDNNSISEETGKAIQVDGGELVIWGDLSQGGFVGNVEKIFMTKISLPLISPITPAVINNNVYDLPAGNENVHDFFVDVNGDYVVGGTGKGGSIAANGPSPTRPFLMKTDANGTVVWTHFYNNAAHLDAIAESAEGIVMTGWTFSSFPAPFPQASLTSQDVWVGKVDRKGVMAECDCFQSIDVIENPLVPSVISPGTIAIDILPNGAIVDIASVVLDTIQEFCSPGCGSGGPGNPCPSGCCSYISGYKFMDGQNGPGSCDGMQDLPFEPNMCGWDIELVDASTNTVIQTAQTNSAGFYAFGNICDGDYLVREVFQNCWIQSAPAGGVHSFNISGTQYHFDVNFGNCPEIDCDRHLNARLTTVSLTPNCTQTVSIDNNSCFDLTRVVISTNNGVDLSNPNPKTGYQLCTLYPPTASQICIEAAGGGAIPTGSNLDLLDLTLTNICSYSQIPQEVIIDYFIELPCGVDRSICSDSLIAECPINCPALCDSVSASYIIDPNFDCCFDINLNIGIADLFTQVNLNTIGSVDMVTRTPLDPAWIRLGSSPSQEAMIYTAGNLCPNNSLRFLPSGSHIPVKVCLDNFTTSPQQIEVEWLTCDAQVCRDTLNFECELPPTACVKIENDTLTCEDDIFKLNFDFVNCWDLPIDSMVISYLNPPVNYTPPFTLFNPEIQIGGTGSGSVCLDTTGLSGLPYLDIQFQFFDGNCCWCFSDTLRYEIPECPCQDCDDLEYYPSFIGTDSTCCWSLDLLNPCLDSMIAIELNLLSGVEFLSQSAGPGWIFQNNSNSNAWWYPAPPLPGTNFVPTGNINNAIEFCLTDYANVSPQQLEINWINVQQDIECQDTLEFECQWMPDTCLVIIGDTLICLPDGSYEYQYEIKNQSTFTATHVQFDATYTNPFGGIVTPSVPHTEVITIPNCTVTSPVPPTAMPPINVNNVLPGDQFCFAVSIFNTAYTPPTGNDCCHGDTICVTIPECPRGGAFTECEDLMIDTLSYLGYAAATCHSGSSPNGYVCGVVDIRNHPTAPNHSNWVPSMYHGTAPNDWTANNIGEVFGLAVDPYGNIYTASCSHYYHPNWPVYNPTFGSAANNSTGMPSIYKLNPYTSTITNLNNTLPQNYDPAFFNQYPSFGNLCYNFQNHRIYVSNLEDGIIYGLDADTGVVHTQYDYGSVDVTNGFAPLGDRVYGVGYNHVEQRIYFSLWNIDLSNPNPGVFNQIWSIGLLANGDFDNSSLTFEFDIPYYDPGTEDWSAPVSDISFDASGQKMILSERQMVDAAPSFGFHVMRVAAHRARTLEYISSSPTIPFSTTYLAEPSSKYAWDVATSMSTYDHNSAGGNDYAYEGSSLMECDSFVVKTEDAIVFQPGNYIYGLRGTPSSGGTSSNWLVDLDANLNTGDKYQIGDVEVFRNLCCEEVQQELSCCDDPDFNLNADATQFSYDMATQTLTLSNDILKLCDDPITIDVDWGDGSTYYGVIGDLDLSHTYVSHGTYTVCILYLVVDDQGVICLEREICEDIIVETFGACSPCEDDLSWDEVDGSNNGIFLDMIEYGGELFIGGNFYNINTVPLQSVVTWDGTGFSDIKPSWTSDARFWEFLEYNNSLFAVAEIFSPPSNTTWDILKWDDVARDWIRQNLDVDHSLTVGNEGRLYHIGEYQGELVLGGEFEMINGTPVNSVALWNPSTNLISPINSLITTGRVRTSIVHNGDLYLGGNFSGPIENVAKVDASYTWSSLGAGISLGNFTQFNGVQDFHSLSSGNLIIGGRFDAANNVGNIAVAGTQSIAEYNPTTDSFSSLGGGVTGVPTALNTIKDIKEIGSDLYFAGYFNNIGGTSANALAYYDGTSYQGFSVTPFGIETIGCFSSTSNNCEIWAGGENILGVFECNTTSTSELHRGTIEVYPNPTSDVLIISVNDFDNQTEAIKINLVDVTGKIVFKDLMEASNGNHVVNMAHLESGLYFLRLTVNNQISIRKVIKQ